MIDLGDFFGGFWVKAGLAALLAIGLVAGYGIWHHKVFQAGVQHQLDLDKAALDNNQKVYDWTAGRIDEFNWPLAQASSVAAAAAPARVVTVTRIIHEHPDFGALYRPAELECLRAQRHAQMLAAATPGASPASLGDAVMSVRCTGSDPQPVLGH